MEIKRELYLSKIRNYYESNLIKVLTGIRRCGKSILLKQIKEELIEQGVKEDHIIYINFEDIEYKNINTSIKVHRYLKKKMKLDGKYYLFFDEIQHVLHFEELLASLKATSEASIFVTGSNSKLLSGDLASLLVGRTVEFKIYPFSYLEAYEYLLLNKIEPSREFIFDYIQYGGMPQRFDYHNEEEIIRYLKDLYEGICNKDIYERNIDIEKYKFNKISSYILANAGREFSATKISAYFNTNNANNRSELDRKTIYNYLDKMEKACLISRVKHYDINGKEKLKNNEKQYATDVGFRFIQTNLIEYADTFYLENIIYNELLIQGYEVFVGKLNQGEIDFVAVKNKKKCLIQVAYYLNSEETIKREFNSFDKVKDSSPKYVFSLDKIDLSRNNITHINIEDFLLHKVTLFLS